MTTFGFEAEYENNVETVMSLLHQKGLAGDGSLHGYHCRCGTCDFDSGYVFRGQNDSSCGGEVISHVFRSQRWNGARECMRHLEEACLDADAEPSLRSGFHVHVGTDRMTIQQKQDAMWAYLRWEKTLGEFAAARWGDVRAFNYSLCGEAVYAFEDFWDMDIDTGGPLVVTDLEGEVSPQVLQDARRTALDYVLNMEDRHMWLNLQTRDHRTWEFRLWNSTRVAWRMEMFARLSMMFMDPTAVAALNAATTINVGTLIDISEMCDPPLHPLLVQQASADPFDGPFTVLAA